MKESIDELLRRIGDAAGRNRRRIPEEARGIRAKTRRTRGRTAAPATPLENRPVPLPAPHPAAGDPHRTDHLRRLDSLPVDGPLRHPLPTHLLPDLPHPQGQAQRLHRLRPRRPALSQPDREVQLLLLLLRQTASPPTPAKISARTEQYWCPIKHARRIKAAHERYPKFFDYGDAEAFRQGLGRLRKQYGEKDSSGECSTHRCWTTLPPVAGIFSVETEGDLLFSG